MSEIADLRYELLLDVPRVGDPVLELGHASSPDLPPRVADRAESYVVAEVVADVYLRVYDGNGTFPFYRGAGGTWYRTDRAGRAYRLYRAP